MLMDEKDKIEINIWKGIIKVPHHTPRWFIVLILAMLMAFWMFLASQLANFRGHHTLDELLIEKKIKTALPIANPGRAP